MSEWYHVSTSFTQNIHLLQSKLNFRRQFSFYVLCCEMLICTYAVTSITYTPIYIMQILPVVLKLLKYVAGISGDKKCSFYWMHPHILDAFNLTINICLIPTFKFIFNSTIQFSYVLL